MEDFDATGRSGSTAIIFLHGMRLARRSWEPQLRLLADEFRVVALDLPGHGARTGQTFCMDAALERIAQVADAQGGGRAVVGGLSLGGYIAMDFAERYPAKTSGLVLAGCTHEPRGILAAPYRLGAWLLERLPQRPLAWSNTLMYRLLYPEATARLLITPGFYFRGGAQAARQVLGRSYREKLGRYPGPVLILNGRRDVFFRRQERAFVAAAQHAHLEVISRAFHLSNLDQPEAFSDAVRRFARTC